MPVIKQGFFEKQPGETIPISVDFWPWLADGEEISSVSITAVVDPNTNDETDVTSTIISGSAQIQNGENDDGEVITNSKVVQKVTSGATLKTYSIRILVTTDESNIYEADLRLKVKEVK